MPERAGRPCAAAGCPAVVPVGQRYCPEHVDRLVDRLYDKQRGTASQRGYGARWRKLRAMFLRTHPLCCDPYGVHQNAQEVALATDVDHVLPLRAGGANRYDNLQSLCHSCHSRKTAQQSSGWGGRSKSLEVSI